MHWSIWAAAWQNQQMTYAPIEDSDQAGHLPSLIRVFSVRMRNIGPFTTYWAHSEDWSDGGCPGWSESSLGARHFVGFVVRQLISLTFSQPIEQVIVSYFLTHRTSKSLSMTISDFFVSACLSYPRIKLLSQPSNHHSGQTFLHFQTWLNWMKIWTCFYTSRTEQKYNLCGGDIVCQNGLENISDAVDA